MKEENQRRLDASIISEGVNGTRNVLTHLGLLEGEITVRKTPIFVEKAKWLRASYSGMFKIMVKNGTFVKKKEASWSYSGPFWRI